MAWSDLVEISLDPATVMVRQGLRPDPWQADFLRCQDRSVQLLCCRQSGKSTSTAAKAVSHVVEMHLRSQPALVLLVARSLRQSGILYRKVRQAYKAIGRPIKVVRETEHELELEDESQIVCLPGKGETIVGYSGVTLLVLDEAARMPETVMMSLVPMLSVSEGKFFMLSTPFGRQGFFYREWEAKDPEWRRFHVTAEQCPRMDPKKLAWQRKRLGAWWYRQDFGCEFLQVEDAIFDTAAVDRAFTAVSPLFVGGSEDGGRQGLVSPEVQPLW